MPAAASGIEAAGRRNGPRNGFARRRFPCVAAVTTWSCATLRSAALFSTVPRRSDDKRESHSIITRIRTGRAFL